MFSSPARVLKASLALAFAVSTMACSDDDNGPGNKTQGTIRFVNSNPTAAYATSSLKAGTQDFIKSVVFGEVKNGKAEAKATAQTFNVVAGTSATALATAELTVKKDTTYYLVFTKRSETTNGLVAFKDTVKSVAGKAKVNFINAVETGSAYDIYVTDAGTDIAGVAATKANVEFEKDSKYYEYTPGAKRIRVTAKDTKTPVLLDMADFNLAAGKTATIVLSKKATGGLQGLRLNER